MPLLSRSFCSSMNSPAFLSLSLSLSNTHTHTHPHSRGRDPKSWGAEAVAADALRILLGPGGDQGAAEVKGESPGPQLWDKLVGGVLGPGFQKDNWLTFCSLCSQKHRVCLGAYPPAHPRHGLVIPLEGVSLERAAGEVQGRGRSSAGFGGLWALCIGMILSSMRLGSFA